MIKSPQCTDKSITGVSNTLKSYGCLICCKAGAAKSALLPMCRQLDTKTDLSTLMGATSNTHLTPIGSTFIAVETKFKINEALHLHANGDITRVSGWSFGLRRA